MGGWAPAHAATINVPADYSTISAAISAADPGDVSSVASGDYDERLTIRKDLTIEGAGASQTTLWYSGGLDTLVTVHGADVALRDLTMGGATDSFGTLKQEAFMGVYADGGTLTVRRCRFEGISFARIQIIDGQMLTVTDAYISNLPFTLPSDLGIEIQNTDFLIRNLDTPINSLIDHNIDITGNATGTVEQSDLGSSSASDNYGQAIRINRDDANGYFPSVTIQDNVIEGHSNASDTEGAAIGLYAGVGTVVTPTGSYQVTIHDNEIRDWPIGIEIQTSATSTRSNPIELSGNLIEDNYQYGVHIHPNSGYTGTGSTRGVDLGGGLSDSPGGNTIRSNDAYSDSYDIYNESSNTLDARFNTWSSSTPSVIDSHIYDDDESSTSGRVRFRDPQTYIVTNVNDSGIGSLRAALRLANDPVDTPADSIHFDISGSGPHTIQPQTALPDVTDPVILDGRTDPQYNGDPVVAIDGSKVSASTLSLETGSAGSSVFGLSLTHSDNDIALFIRSDGNLVDGCWVGVAPDGTTTPSSSWGIRTFGSSNQFGDPFGEGNVIVSMATGLDLANASPPGNVVLNNRIGETAAGVAAGNNVGIHVGTGTGSADENVIGGTSPSQGNLIAHNTAGVVVEDDALHTRIRGNRIVDQATFGIDLGNDARTSNDPGDGDAGENRLQNVPEIQDATYQSGANTVEVTYRVPSDPSLSGAGASAYPIVVDFYRAGSAGGADAWIGSDAYTASSPDDYGGCSAAPCPVTATFTPKRSVTRSDRIVATATDADGNTSELTGGDRPLPVELTSFTADVRSDAVELRWRTASESGNARFEVQRKAQAGGTIHGGAHHASNWQTIGRVEGAGTSTQPRTYRFTDSDLPYDADSLTYRLRQVDVTGAATHSGERTVHRPVREARLLKTVPNPAGRQVAVRYAVPNRQRVRISLYDVLGRRVQTVVDGTKQGRQETPLSVSALPSGVYFVRMTTRAVVQSHRLTVVR